MPGEDPGHRTGLVRRSALGVLGAAQEGADAGKVQYVAEEITDIAPPGSILQQGQAIARYAPSGTGIEFGWSTINGITLARATTGHGGGQLTLAGQSMRAWLNSLGANAGPRLLIPTAASYPPRARRHWGATRLERQVPRLTCAYS